MERRSSLKRRTPLRAKPRAKGNRAELDIRNQLHDRGWKTARRNWQSGGQGGSDLIEAIPGYGIEVKHREQVKVREWLAQAAEASSRTETPLLVHRVNNKPWRASLPAEDLKPLLELNGNPPIFEFTRNSDRLQLWKWIAQAAQDCALHHPQGARAIPIVTYTWPGAPCWYSDLLFDTLLDLIVEAQS